MSDELKVSGKRVALPETSAQWKLTSRPGGWMLAERIVQGVAERKRLALTEVKNFLSATIAGHAWHGELIRKTHGHGASQGGGDSDLVAQFPGKVRKILVIDGAQVQEGDRLLLVEAMKMEFAIKAPGAGTITRVLVKEGQQLTPGDRFVDFQSSEASE